MRPLEIELTAFRSYDHAAIDLRANDLVVITGDTGAGKTTLLDAVSFALFGRTPEQSRVTELLTLGHTHGEVRLTFAARGDVWRVVRRYGKDAPDPALVVERLDGDGGEVLDTLAGGTVAGARLEEVIGMTFPAFTSAVLLAQGRFAEFLTAAPRARDAILRELFGVASLEGARLAAVAREKAASTEAEIREADAAALPRHDAGARADAARAAREAAAVRAAARGLRAVAEDVGRHRTDADAARARRDSALRAAGELPDAEEAAALAESLGAARRAATAADAARAEATTTLGGLVAARDALRERHGGGATGLAALRERAERARRLEVEMPPRRAELAEREALLATRRAALAAQERELAAMAEQHDEVAAREAMVVRAREAAARVTGTERDLAEARAAAAAAAERRTAAEGAVKDAESALEAARRQDLAATLQHGLSPGDPCPVCGAAIGTHLPDTTHLDVGRDDLSGAREAAAAAGRVWAGADERVRAAEGALADAQAARTREEAALREAGVAADADDVNDPEAARRRAELLEAARGALRAEEREVSAEGARCESARARLDEDAAAHAADRASLGDWAAQDDPIAALGAAIAEVGAAEAAADAAATRAAGAADAAAAALAEVARLESGPVAALRTAAARVAARGDLDAPGDDLGAEELIAAAVTLRGAVGDAAAAHDRRAEVSEAAARTASARLAEAGGALGVAEPEQLTAVLRRAEGAHDTARGRLASVEEASRQARRLRAQAAAAAEQARVHRQVANDLKANAFPRYLLARYRERLAVGASARLNELSGGAYRFAGTEPDPLAVIDTRRGERRRSAATLSGGERFLASLALALGLSDVAAEAGGRLDCLFLDEGFSTLDAESLEQALAGVERLAGDGRLVAVITHLPGVADRLGAAIHVSKDPVSGISSVSAGMVSA